MVGVVQPLREVNDREKDVGEEVDTCSQTLEAFGNGIDNDVAGVEFPYIQEGSDGHNVHKIDDHNDLDDAYDGHDVLDDAYDGHVDHDDLDDPHDGHDVLDDAYDGHDGLDDPHNGHDDLDDPHDDYDAVDDAHDGHAQLLVYTYVLLVVYLVPQSL